MAVTYEELQGSPQESWDVQGGFSATRSLLCAWADRRTLIGELLYTQYPYQPRPAAYATKATIQPYGKIINYQNAATTDATEPTGSAALSPVGTQV